jgi:hypothetical protein
MLVSIATSSEIDERELKQFIVAHPSLKLIDPAFAHQYDDAGNFKELDLHMPGPAVSNEYLEWHLEKAIAEADSGAVITQEEFITRLAKIREPLLTKKNSTSESSL